MNDGEHQLRDLTRRHFFGKCAVGVGSIALNWLLLRDGHAAASSSTRHSMTPRAPMFPPKAKRVIFLFMAGGPSQLELFDDKPKLRELHGQKPPPSLLA